MHVLNVHTHLHIVYKYIFVLFSNAFLQLHVAMELGCVGPRSEFRLYCLLAMWPSLIFLTPPGFKYVLPKIRGLIVGFSLSFDYGFHYKSAEICRCSRQKHSWMHTGTRVCMTWKTVLAFLKLIHGLEGRNSWTEVLNFIHLSCRTPQISLGSRIIIKFSVLTETSLQFFPMCLRFISSWHWIWPS